MKKIFLVVFVLTLFACNNKSKEEKDTEIKTEKKKEKAEAFLSKVVIPESSVWFKNEISITDSSESFNGDYASLISRTSAHKSAYSGINNIKVTIGSNYKLSVIAKKGSVGKNFALRMQGVYPNRVDAVFDLETGLVKETLLIGTELAENNKATMEFLGDGWYKCSLSADIFANQMRIVFGPTTNKLKTGLWETRTGELSNTIIVTESLQLLEL
jgi:hypothetical protein